MGKEDVRRKGRRRKDREKIRGKGRMPIYVDLYATVEKFLQPRFVWYVTELFR